LNGRNCDAMHPSGVSDVAAVEPASELRWGDVDIPESRFAYSK